MKEIIRMENLSKRNSFSKQEIGKKSRQIEESLVSLPEFEKAKAVMAYYGVKNEVKTRSLIEKALKAGKKVALPTTNFEKKTITPIQITSLEQLETRQGLAEPTGKNAMKTSEFDLIIVPGVAFDKKGGRIGRGKGFYDELLRKTGTKVLLVGLCFEENLEESLPSESHDIKMDLIITDRQTIRCRP